MFIIWSKEAFSASNCLLASLNVSSMDGNAPAVVIGTSSSESRGLRLTERARPGRRDHGSRVLGVHGWRNMGGKLRNERADANRRART